MVAENDKKIKYQSVTTSFLYNLTGISAVIAPSHADAAAMTSTKKTGNSDLYKTPEPTEFYEITSFAPAVNISSTVDRVTFVYVIGQPVNIWGTIRRTFVRILTMFQRSFIAHAITLNKRYKSFKIVKPRLVLLC